MSDHQRIRKWFKNRRTLTVAQAIHDLHVYNLCVRVGEMDDIKRDDKLRRVVRVNGSVSYVGVWRRV